jgi:integrase
LDLIEDLIAGLPSKRTKDGYKNNFGKFLSFLQLDGNLTLIEQAQTFLDKAKQDEEWAQNQVISFLIALDQGQGRQKLAAGTIKNYYKAIKLFCDLNRIILGWKRILRYIGRTRKVANDRIPLPEEMRKWITARDRRVKFAILMMSSCGMRLDAWKYLQWKHVKPIMRDGKVVAANIKIYADEPEQYATFITPEAFQALEEWMETRKREGEKIFEDSWLMRKDWSQKGLGFGAANPKNLTIPTKSVKKMLAKALREQGIRGKPRTTSGAIRYEFSSSHSLRKWFHTKTLQGGMNILSLEMLMGHETGLPAHYIRPTESELLEEYLKVVDHLTVNKQVVMEQVSMNQQALTAEMQAKDLEMQGLRKQLADVIEQQQGFDMKFHKLLDIVDQLAVITHDKGDGVTGFIGEEIVKMMPRQPTKEQRLQRIREFQEVRRREADAKYLYDD